MPENLVIKRDGRAVAFDEKKIYRAIKRAAGSAMKPSDIQYVVDEVLDYFKNDENVSVEEIQDEVENALMHSRFTDVARDYVRYRQIHEMKRKANDALMEEYNDLLFTDPKDMDLKRDNANINTDAPMGIMLKLGTEGAKSYVYNYFLDEKVSKACKDGILHYHDADFSLITFNCLQQDLTKTLRGGFNTGHGFLREPNSIRAAAALACITIQSSQNDMFGGQSINAWDHSLAPYVNKSFVKAIKKTVHEWCRFKYLEEHPETYKAFDNMTYHMSLPIARKIICEVLNNNDSNTATVHDADVIYRTACDMVKDETHQAMEAAIHNFNSLHSRAGSQVPFSSINYGTDTTPEGRLIIDETLNAIDAGLGNGETPIFPISIFQIKKGFNYNPEDPNYDLFEKACKVSAKRLFPNFLNEDAPYNAQYYKKGDYNSLVASMGCRTRVMSNVNGPEISGSRGNFAFMTINLPMLGLMAKKKYPNDQEKRIGHFYKLYDEYIDMCHDTLLKRYDVIAHKKAKNFPFLMGQGIWLDSEKLEPEDEIAPVLKHASISIGFCGLAECLVALTGKHHGESDDSQKLGLEIVGHLRERTDDYTQKEHMNWSTFGTPAESTAGEMARACQKKFGKVPGVCDREYLSNSSHVPVYYHTSFKHKVDVEAPYHALENAG